MCQLSEQLTRCAKPGKTYSAVITHISITSAENQPIKRLNKLHWQVHTRRYDLAGYGSILLTPSCSTGDALDLAYVEKGGKSA